MSYTDAYKVNWKQVLEIEEYIYSTSSWKVRIGIWLKLLLKIFFRLPGVGEKKKNVDYLFIKSMVRDDYDKLYYQIAACCPKEKLVENIVYHRREGLRVFRFNIYTIWIFLKYSPLLASFIRWNIPKTIFLITHVLRCLDINGRINNKIAYKKLVVFADMQSIDSMLVQMAKLMGITTVTLQHGLYIDYTRMENINSTNYKNHVADYFLAWGSSTKDLIKKFNPDANVEVCGKPLTETETKKTMKEYFSVLLDQNLLKKNNQELIKIAYELQKRVSLKVNIRFHPRNKHEDYEILKDVTYTDRGIESSVFILAHTTSMIHELLRVGIPVFKLRSNVPALAVPEFLKFSTTDELENAIKEGVINEHDFKDDGKEFIRYIGDESLGKYKEFFLNL